MENASKALIIAGAILVSIMIISLGMMIFRNMKPSVENAAKMDQQEIQAFNSKIMPYLGDNVPGSQVNALLQYCSSANISANREGSSINAIEVKYYDEVIVNSAGIISHKVQTGGYFYKVSGDDTSGNGLIDSITITNQ